MILRVSTLLSGKPSASSRPPLVSVPQNTAHIPIVIHAGAAEENITWIHFTNGYFSFMYPAPWDLEADDDTYQFQNGTSAPLIRFSDPKATDQKDEGSLAFYFKSRVPNPNSAMPNYITVSHLDEFEPIIEGLDKSYYEIVNKHGLLVDGYAAIEYDKMDRVSRTFAGEVICIETSGYFITALLDPVVQLSWSADPEVTAHTVVDSLTLSKGL